MNKVVLVGRIGQDPEKRATQSGTSISNFSLATNESFRDQSGQTNDITEWHRCAAFGKTADFINSYVRKGRLVYIDGRLRTRKWTDNNNATHYSTEIHVDTAMLLDKRDDGGGGQVNYDKNNYNQQTQNQNQNLNQTTTATPNPGSNQAATNNSLTEDNTTNDEELPF